MTTTPHFLAKMQKRQLIATLISTQKKAKGKDKE